MGFTMIARVSMGHALVPVSLITLIVIGSLLVARDALVLPGTEGMPEYRDLAFHAKVLVPRPVPWPLLAVPGYGALVGGLAWLVETVTA
ncbi:hypothetical protein [Streptomyces noursei]|uniref:hypothetical protein n=1 Tax=Streptomyces noursei TaxID=1971 RepID=UPI00045F039E|nr:hypothetical protein [Streptomyces noursei]AIA02415.1 hypothetical protein DC74_1901 [Streptomyces noursei]